MKTVTFILALSIGLTGCAITPKNDKSLGQKCESAPVLFTNLSLPINDRQYMLPDGSLCGAQS